MMHSLNWLEELEEMNNKKQNIEEVFENNLSIQTRIRCMPPKNITTNHVLKLQSCDPWKFTRKFTFTKAEDFEY
jgi:hypothetical protein